MKRFINVVGSVLAIPFLLSFTGCMTPARKLNQDAVDSQLHPGQTRAEVRKILGKPDRTAGPLKGKSLDVFDVIRPNMRFPSYEVRSVDVLYDAGGHLEKFTWSSGQITETGYLFIGFWRAGLNFTDADLKKIKRNGTTREALITLFGKPTIEGINVYGKKTICWVQLSGDDYFLQIAKELEVALNDNSVVTDYSLITPKK